MLGAEHYGLQVGEIFHGDRRATKDGIHTQSEKTNWWCYNLPPPALGNAVVPFSKKRGFYTTQHDIRVGRGVAGLGRWSFQRLLGSCTHRVSTGQNAKKYDKRLTPLQ
jgi:hypothetical protein